MKVDELRVLEADELGMRLRTARRELYELRFKHAVGQLENSTQISKVRHDIARILTVLRERDFGFGPAIVEESAVAVAEPEAVTEPEPEAEAPEEPAGEVVVEQPPKRGRGRGKKESA